MTPAVGWAWGGPDLALRFQLLIHSPAPDRAAPSSCQAFAHLRISAPGLLVLRSNLLDYAEYMLPGTIALMILLITGLDPVKFVVEYQDHKPRG